MCLDSRKRAVTDHGRITDHRLSRKLVEERAVWLLIGGHAYAITDGDRVSPINEHRLSIKGVEKESFGCLLSVICDHRSRTSDQRSPIFEQTGIYVYMEERAVGLVLTLLIVKTNGRKSCWYVLTPLQLVCCSCVRLENRGRTAVVAAPFLSQQAPGNKSPVSTGPMLLW